MKTKYTMIQKLLNMLDIIQAEILQLKLDKFPTDFEEGQEYVIKILLKELGNPV